ALVAAQALARVALAAEQNGGFLAGACEPLAAQATAALAQALGRLQTDRPHAAVRKAWLVVKLQHHGEGSQLAQGAPARGIGGAPGRALLLAQRRRARLPIARAKAELVIEPPRARLDGLLVVRAELVWIDDERGHVLERVDDGEAARVDRGGVAPAPRREDVVVDLGPATEPAALQVAYGHAVLDHEIRRGPRGVAVRFTPFCIPSGFAFQPIFRSSFTCAGTIRLIASTVRPSPVTVN